MAALLEETGLQSFEQYAQGRQLFENEYGQLQRNAGFASMQGSWRLRGGWNMLVSALYERLNKDQVRLSTTIGRLAHSKGGIEATDQGGQTLLAKRVVLAIPPRLAANLNYSPRLPSGSIAAMQNTPTWMAGQAKSLAVYDRAFWREAGLSGDAMSRRGPMVEIHDASPADQQVAALFGFIGVPPGERSDQEALGAGILDQLARLFGPEARHPRSLSIKDWAADALTATDLDQEPLLTHPQYGRPESLERLWNGHLLLGGTEMASQFGGYLEGALEASDAVLQRLGL